MQPPGGVTRTIEAGLTLFSGAEIRVVLLPVGEAPEAVFQRYASLIVRHRQVELNNVRSFYKEAQKSPFKFFPWKSGNMHFRFLPEELALEPAPLAALHSHRRVLGVVGVMHCPAVEDVAKAYLQFEQRCKAFPDAFTVRCFAFEPSDGQIQEDRKGQRNFIMFPPGDYEQLDNHAEVVMHDFAACLLGELERWMLTASPAMVELTGQLVDAPEFAGAPGALEAVQTRLLSDEELKTKKRYGRLQKAMGDYCLLAGSPLDAQDHYSTAVELGRTAQDWLYLGAGLEGYAAAKVLNAAISHGAFAINQSSVFNDEEQWRTPRKEATHEGDADGSVSEASRSSSAFGGAQFWAALRGVEKLESEVRALFAESKASMRRRGGQPLLVESDLKLARFIAGLHGGLARRELSEVVSQLQAAAELLPLPEDRLLAFVEGAQVLGLVGSARKRVLLLWQAVELSKFLGFPTARTLDVARKALEPPDDPQEPDSEGGPFSRGRPLAQSAVPRSWPQVRAGCLEAVLGLAIYAKQHADVWDAAAALLREHSGELSAHRQQSLLENLLAAASQMAAPDKARPGPGPPPLLFFRAPRPPPLSHRPMRFTVVLRPAAAALGGRPGSGPFLYDPFSAKREQAAAKSQAEALGPVEWVCGEVAGVEVEVANPAAVGMRIDKLVLEAGYLGDPAMAPREYMTLTSTTQAAWKPKPVSLNIPAGTKPVRIILEGTPLVKGMLVLTGCRLTAFGGVSWFQPWSRPAPTAAQQLAGGHREAGSLDPAPSGLSSAASGAPNGGGSAAAAPDPAAAAPEARVAVVEPLPLVRLSLAPAEGEAGGQGEAAEGLGLLGRAAAPPGDKPAAAAARPALRLLQGQACAARLIIANSGKAPVGWASISVRQLEPAGRLSVEVDAAALLACLPLPPGAACSVPVTFAAGVWAAHAAEELLAAEICLEYVSAGAAAPLLQNGDTGGGGGDAASGDAASGDSARVLGRHAVLQVEVAVQPSVQVAAVAFRTLYLPASGGGGGGCQPSAFERRCVMEVAVASRGRWPLQVWLGPGRPEPGELLAAAQRDGLLPPALPPGAQGLPAAGLLRPGRRCSVAYLVDEPCTSSGDGGGGSGAGGSGGGGAARPPGGGGGPTQRQPASPEDQQRQACAERLSRALSLFYRVDADEAGIADCGVGCAPLVHGEVYKGLGYESLSQLQPCALTVRLTAEPLTEQQQQRGEEAAAAGGVPPLQLVAPLEGVAGEGVALAQPQQRQEQATAPYARVPALTAGLGQPLCVTLTVTNHGAAASEESGTAAADGGGGPLEPAAGVELQLNAALACQPVRGSEQEDGGGQPGQPGQQGAAELTAVWSGQLHSALRLSVPPGGTVTQRLGLCLLAQGLYQVGLRHWQCQPAGAAASEPQPQQQQQRERDKRKKAAAPPPAGQAVNTLVAVEPCFVLAQ